MDDEYTDHSRILTYICHLNNSYLFRHKKHLCEQNANGIYDGIYERNKCSAAICDDVRRRCLETGHVTNMDLDIVDLVLDLSCLVCDLPASVDICKACSYMTILNTIISILH